MSILVATPFSQLARHRASFFAETHRVPARLALLCSFLWALLGSSAVSAQTAHFSGALTTLGSGFSAPENVVMDASGNIFVADESNSQVKEILAVGGYTTVRTIGSGFSYPSGVAVDASGNVFVADYNHSAVKEVLAAGGYTTVNTIGSGFSVPNGVALDASGNVFVADSGNNAVKEILAAGGYTTVITLNNSFNYPTDLKVDGSGNIFVADSGNNAVKEIVAAGGYTTVNTVGSGFHRPAGVALDGTGNLFVASYNSNPLHEVLAAGGYTTVVSNIPAIFNNPSGLALDGSGNLFIADNSNNAVKEFMTRAANFRSVDVNTSAPITLPLYFTFDSGGTIQAPSVVTQGISGLDFTDAGTGSCTTNGSSHIYSAGDTCTVNVTFNPKAPGMRQGAVVLLNASNQDIATGLMYGTGIAGTPVFDAAPISTVPVAVSSRGYLYGLTVTANGDLYDVDEQLCVVNKYTAGVTTTVAGSVCATGIPTGDGGPATSATLRSPSKVAVDGAGNLYIVDLVTIRKVDAHTGLISTVAGTGTGGYTADGALAVNADIYSYGVVLDGSGNIYFSDDTYSLVRKVDAKTGILTTVAGNYQSGRGYSGDNGPATSAQLKSPLGIAMDGAGNLYIADTDNFAIRKVAAGTGLITTIAGVGPANTYNCPAPVEGGAATSALLCDPEDVATDAAGNVYIADSNNELVRKVTASTGIITTAAGTYHNHQDAYTGDGGPANQAGLSYFEAVAVDGNGNIYIADSDNYVVRKVAAGSAIAAFGAQNVGSPSTPKDVTLSNGGTAPLTLSNIATSANFNLQGSNTSCSSSTSLVAGTSCILGIVFQPTTSGSLMGAITLTDDANNVASSTQSVALSGTGTQPAPTQLALSALVTPIPAGGNLGTVTATVEDANGNPVTNSTAAITATITGPNGYSQTVTANAVNGVASLNLSSLPLTTAGIYTVATSSPGLTGSSSVVTVNAPRDVNFGSVNVDTSAPITRTLTFTFSTAGVIQAPSVVTQGTAGLDFTDAGTGTCTTNGTSHAYSAGDTCTVDVTFNPKFPGQRIGAVELLSSGGSIAKAYVYGTGVASQAGFEGASVITTVPVSALASDSYPWGVTTDAAGNLYIADNSHGVVIKQTVGGTSSVIAGTGTRGTAAGSGVPATSATFYGLATVAVDGRGDLYIVDSQAIRKVDARTGIITTVVGTLGVQGYSPDGTPATSATLNGPTCVIVDPAGNLYIVDTTAEVVRKVDAVTGLLSTVAGNHALGGGYSGDGGLATNAKLGDPYGAGFDVQGNLYIAEAGNNAVRKVDAITGIITTVAGMPGASPSSGYSGDGGLATSAKLYDPEAVSVDAAGNLYIADSSNLVVRKVSATTGIITTIAGVFNSRHTDSYTGDGGPANKAGFSYFEGLALGADGTLYIPNGDTSVVRSVKPAGIASFGSFAVGTASPAQNVTVINNGNAALNLSALASSTNFNLQGSNTSCSSSTSLSAGTSCILGIVFQPTTSGSLMGTITLTDNANNDATSTQTVALSGTGTQSAATQLAVSGVASTVVSGGNLGTISATVEDANGNTVTTSTASVTATVTGPNGYSQTVTAAAVNGGASLNLSSLNLTTAGTYTVTTSGTGLTGTSSTVTVTAGTASKLAASAVASTVVSGGNLGTISATVEDANGNTVTTSTASVTATVTGPNGYSQTVTAAAVNGVASLNLSSLNLTTAGTYTVTTSGAGLTGTSSTVTVTAGAASTIVLGPAPTSITSGQRLGTTTATIKDANGNTVTTSVATLMATLTGPNGYSQTVTGTSVNGVASLNLNSLTPTAAGTYTLLVSGSGLTPVSSIITVADAAQTIALPSLPNVTYGAGATTLPSTTSAGLPITYAVTGPATLNGSSLAVTGAGTVTITATQAGDASHSSVTLTQSFTVAKAASSTTLSSSSGVATTGTAVTLTTQVASTAGTPTGTVTFLNGSIVLGTATVSSTGSATLTLSTLPTGALSLTVAYSGDANFRASISALAVTTVQDFGIAATAGTPSVPVVPGSAASFTLALTPGTAGFSSAITVTATGLPAGATYSFSPATITPGSAMTSTVLTVQTTKPVATARRLEGAAGIAFALLFVPFGISRKGREALRKSRPLSAFGVLLLLGGLAGLTGCGTSNGFFGQPGASYTITVTATSGTLVHSTTVTLNVQ